jgi:7-carboxy-7-deazaguanine synthase
MQEMFYSIQGEGALIGCYTFFVRVSGCSQKCCWCDEKKAWKAKNDIHVVDLINKIHEVDKDTWICFTGGEPLEQLKSVMWLISKLDNTGYKKLSIETSGVLGYDKKGAVILPDQKEVLDMVNSNLFFSISPKLYGALKDRFNYDELKKLVSFWIKCIDLHFRYQLKFVASCDEDFLILSDLVKDIPIINCNVFLQIESSKVTDKDFIKKSVAFVKNHPIYRLTIQQHKILNIK